MKRRSQKTEKKRAASPYAKKSKAPFNYSAMYADLPVDSELRRWRTKRTTS